VSLACGMIAYSHTSSLCCGADIIDVNLTYPERNREVLVFKFKGLADDSGNIVDGFQVTMPIDHRDFAEDFYKLEIVNDNELSLHMPSLPYQMQFDSVHRFAEFTKLQVGCKERQKAQEICIMDVNGAPSRRLKKLLLRFPEDVVLVNLSSPIDKVIPADILPYSFKTDTFGAMMTQWACTVSWKIGDSNSKVKAFGKTPQKKGNVQLNAIFSKSCSMSDN